MTVKLQAPIEVEVKISVVNDEGMQGVATLSLTRGRYPTEVELRECVAKFEREDLPEGFRLMNKREWFNSVFGQCREEDEDGEPHYINFSIPGGESWEP